MTRANLHGVKLTPEQGAGIAALRYLTRRSLTKVRSTTRALQRWAVREPKIISLNYCSITNAGITNLGEKPELELLGLTGANITIQSVERLSHDKNLREFFSPLELD